MKVFETVIETQNYIKSHSAGFVPTMGALHDGHISLIRQAKEENEITVASIFVNPAQFNNPDDLARYPRTPEADLDRLEKAGCDVVFVPSVQEMYPEPAVLKMDFGRLEQILEGAFRPGHFNGVGLVVSKLFHIVRPERAYFGQKDIQQCAVINRLVNDLSFGIELIFCDTVREADGLAMSSRNVRLSPEKRQVAPFIYQSLLKGKELLLNGTGPAEVERLTAAAYAEHPDFRLEYYQVVAFSDLEQIPQYDPSVKTAIVVAAHLDGVRLIDNLVF
ncbi:MAG: pantoate--beta-alanine ligase [Leadbetterella sp.]|nr:pantoate--beta-alanine ligase [Leadbetterella sp.]